jgi:hypothetical protein
MPCKSCGWHLPEYLEFFGVCSDRCFQKWLQVTRFSLPYRVVSVSEPALLEQKKRLSYRVSALGPTAWTNDVPVDEAFELLEDELKLQARCARVRPDVSLYIVAFIISMAARMPSGLRLFAPFDALTATRRRARPSGVAAANRPECEPRRHCDISSGGQRPDAVARRPSELQ